VLTNRCRLQLVVKGSRDVESGVSVLSAVDDGEVSRNVGLCSDEVSDTDTEMVSSLPCEAGGAHAIHVEHLPVARVQRRTGSAQGESCPCSSYKLPLLVVNVR